MRRIIHYSKAYTVDEVEFLLSQLGAVDSFLPVPEKFRETVGNDISDLSRTLLLTVDDYLYYTNEYGELRCIESNQLNSMRKLGYRTDIYAQSNIKNTILQYLCVRSIAGVVVDTITLADTLVTLYTRIRDFGCNALTDFQADMRREYNKRVVNRHVFINQFADIHNNKWADVNTEWDDVVYSTYGLYIGIQDWFDRHRSYCEFTKRYPSFNHHEVLVRLINKISLPKYNKIGAAKVYHDFDTLTVELGLTEYDKTNRDALLHRYSKVLTKCVLGYIESTPRWQHFGVPITILKPDRFTITKDDRLVMIFALKDELVTIANACSVSSAR